MKRKISVLLFIIMIPVFTISFLATTWAGSYLMLDKNWKQQIIFTPKTATTSQQIYDIDKFIYAFKLEPLTALVCVFLLFYSLG